MKKKLFSALLMTACLGLSLFSAQTAIEAQEEDLIFSVDSEG